MHALWNFFLAKRAFTILMMIALTVGGLFSLVTIPKESAPEVIIPVGIVTTILPGGSAEDIEQLITNKIEDEVKTSRTLIPSHPLPARAFRSSQLNSLLQQISTNPSKISKTRWTVRKSTFRAKRRSRLFPA